MTETCFKPVRGLKTCLEDDLLRDDCALDISKKHGTFLCQLLGDKYHTYLVLCDGVADEVIKVTQTRGLLTVARGQDDTCAYDWPCGTTVKFDWTESGIRELNKKAEEDPECPEETFTGEIKSGNCTVEFKDGVAIKSKPNKYQIPDGCYTHPVPTYEDGCIIKIANGSEPTRYQPTCGPQDSCGKPSWYSDK